MSITYLTSDDIKELHDLALERYGGLPGEKEPGLIEFIAEKPMSWYFGEEQYPGLFMKAAVYMEGLADRQFFSDGNKRTAYLSTATFLVLNGYGLDLTDDELYEFATAVAEKKLSMDEIAQFLQEHSILASLADYLFD